MDDDLINLSLNQGKQFKNYQGKIKTYVENQIHVEKSKRITKNKEGFTTNTDPGPNLLKQRDRRAKMINQTNQSDLNKLNKLQTKHNNLQGQYNDKQKQVNARSLVLINRTSPNNPYLNKNISLPSKTSRVPIKDLGYGGYVTGQGIFKPYPDKTTFDSVAGKNGCPKTIMSNIPVNDYSSSLAQGTNMIANQSCGNEGKNVYVTKLINNPTTSYIGCYNDKPISTNVIAIPLMNSSNLANGFGSNASSIFRNNNKLYGPWAAFDQNPNTFWHSSSDISTKYNETTGVYEGKNQVIFNSINSGILTVKGEYLQIDMPNINNETTNTGTNQTIKVVQYDIAPRIDNKLFLTRSPNTWYLLGYRKTTGQWYEVDRKIGEKFTSSMSKTYYVTNPGDYSAYIILTEKVGNDDQKTIRSSLQIAELKLYSNSESTFTNADRAMIYNSSAIGYTTFEKCKKYSLDNDYQYFGLQDLQSNGTAMCLVSNDYDETIEYGNASNKINSALLWASNTGSGQQNMMQLAGSGQIKIYDINNTTIFTSNQVDPKCVNSGDLQIDSATYGGNCKAPIGNITTKVGIDMKCNNSKSCSIPISNNAFGDPSIGCVKSFDVAYKCGNKSFTKNLATAEGQTMILDCSSYINKTCQYILLLEDDGNMCLYKGNTPSSKTDLLWSTRTNKKQKGLNPDWVASKGKYGRNYMLVGETLVADEWIGSNNGSIRLIMQKDGNLVLYTSELKLGCSVKNNKTFGSNWVNAVYKIDDMGDKNVLGKIAYIDGETKLREYPDSLLSKSNQYQLFNDFDASGNNIGEPIITTTGQQGCIDACNKNKDCSGFVYQPKGNMCYLKDSGMYPNNKKQFYSNSGLVLGVRNLTISPSVNSSCSKDIVNIDSIQYNNYIKGDPMTKTTKCAPEIVLDKDKKNLINLQNNILLVGEQSINQSNNLYNENQNNYNTVSKNSVQLNKNANMYKKNDIKIKSELNLSSNFNLNNNKEGMKNMNTNEKIITMNDINSMLSDTDIKLLQENYSYIFWSILAIGILTVTIKEIKK